MSSGELQNISGFITWSNTPLLQPRNCRHDQRGFLPPPAVRPSCGSGKIKQQWREMERVVRHRPPLSQSLLCPFRRLTLITFYRLLTQPNLLTPLAHEVHVFANMCSPARRPTTSNGLRMRFASRSRTVTTWTRNWMRRFVYTSCFGYRHIVRRSDRSAPY